MISLSFLNRLGVDIIQLFWVCFQWASSLQWSQPVLLGEAELYSHTPGIQRQRRPEGKGGGRGEGGGGGKKERVERTRLARALAPYSRN